MKIKFWIILLLGIFIGCVNQSNKIGHFPAQQSLPDVAAFIPNNTTNDIQQLINDTDNLNAAFNPVDYNYITNELQEIYYKILQSKRLGLHRIILTDGYYSDVYWPEFAQNYVLQEIIYRLECQGYTCTPYYRENFGNIMLKNYRATTVGLKVEWP